MFKNKLSFILNCITKYFLKTVHCAKFTWIRSENLFDTISVILDHKLVRHKSEALVWPEH